MARTGRAIMSDHIAELGMCRLADLKKGDKFYGDDWDDNTVYELIDLRITLGEEDLIEYVVRELGEKLETHMKTHGTGVVNRTIVCRYKGRDRGSFMAGFRAATNIYQKHMQIFDKENAGLDNPFQKWQTMHAEYNKWKK